MVPDKTKNRLPAITRWTYGLVFVALFIYILIQAKSILSPLVLAVIFSYMLFPFVNLLEKWRIHRILANLISIILLISILSVGLFLIIKNVEVLLSDIPNLKEKAFQNIDQLEKFIAETFGYTIEKQKEYFKDFVAELFKAGSTLTKSIFTATTTTIFQIAVLPVFIFYMLYYRERLYDFILMVVPGKKVESTDAIIKEIRHVTPRYLGGIFTVVLILAILNSLGLFIIGLKYAILFGIISALFNIIPYFGTWIGASIPFLFALLTGSPRLALFVILLFIVIQFLENNILTPNITGRHVRLNPFVTILLIIIGGKIWGIIGMFVIVPVMAMLKIIFEHSKNLKPYAFLICVECDDDKKSKHFINIKRILRMKKTRIKKSR